MRAIYLEAHRVAKPAYMLRTIAIQISAIYLEDSTAIATTKNPKLTRSFTTPQRLLKKSTL